MSLEWVDLWQTVASSVALVGPLAAGSGITLRCDVTRFFEVIDRVPAART